ncbi:MAG: glycosyltransferase [Paludibacteraceae bacterium]|nr:glycosyltransferase [Paludibacteraceae bacterium]
MSQPLVSICIPCFGRKEQLRNTIISIYKGLDSVEISDFEVVISENDSSKQLESLVREFSYPNLKYFYTECEGFLNSFYVLTYATGKFLLLHNSQESFCDKALETIMNVVKKNEESKPLVAFTSGFLLNGKTRYYNDYNKFMHDLSYWSSWSNSFSIWKEDFDVVKNRVEFNSLFPHTSVFATQSNKGEFIIVDEILFQTQFVPKRGGHNKFHAFSVEYPSILEKLVESGTLSEKVYKYILNSIFCDFLPSLYFNVKICGIEKFESDGFKEDLKKYFPDRSFYSIVLLSLLSPAKKIYAKIKKHFL